MNIVQDIRQRVKALFHKEPSEAQIESRIETTWENWYRDISLINFAEIFANRLTNYTLDGAVATCSDEAINGCVQDVMETARKWEQLAYGVGRCYLVPYIMNNRIYTDIISQSRVEIMKVVGNDVTSIAVQADVRQKNSKTYERWTLYEFDEGAKTFTIINKASERNGIGEVPLSIFDDWATIEPEVVISGVEIPLFAYVDCPKDNRQSDMLQGASITFGCEDTIAQIRTTLIQYAKEYELKKAFVGVDREMIDKKTGRVPDIFQTFEGKSTESLFEIYSPDIRSESYKSRLLELFSLLEKQVGTSSGILTPADANVGTATQVRRGAYDTLSLVETARRSIVRAVSTLCAIYDIYLNLLGIAHSHDYVTKFTWKDSMLIDEGEQFQRMIQAQSSGIVSKIEVRKMLYPDETEEQAAEAIKAIEAEQPKYDMEPSMVFGS